MGTWERLSSPLQPPSHPCSTFAVSAEGSQACAKGCELCSEVNGCLKCSPKLFILLERNDIRQVGVCLPSCPPGYFDARNPDMNKCISECGQGWRRAPRPRTLVDSKRRRGDSEMRADETSDSSYWSYISPDIPSTFPTVSPPSKPAPTCIPTGHSGSQAITQAIDLRANSHWAIPHPSNN